MKTTFVILGLVAVVSALQQDTFKLPAATVLRIKNISDSCAAEHNVDPSLFSIMLKGALPVEENNNKYYLHCFCTKAGLVDADGHIVVDKLAGLAGDHPRVGEFREALTKCNDITNEDPVSTVVQMRYCYAETSPILLVVE